MKKNPYLLPGTVRPKEYVLELVPDLQKGTFTGKENILITIEKKTKTITLHAKDVVIDHASLPNLPAAKIEYDKKMETTVLSFAKPLSEGNTILSLTFYGTLREDMRGFYKSTYTVNGKEKMLATTQFEATDARKCFPCFDEPAQKAVFSVTLVIPQELTAISNMPIKKETPLGPAKRVEFEKTPVMSTYLLAFLIGEFEGIEKKTSNNTLVRVFTTPGKKEQGRFALDVAVKSLEYYDDYFGIPYPLPKLDLIAIPDFESGAMENWGAVTYRETALLIDEKNSAAAARQRVAIVVAHELAHQWFGNLVTMWWWNDLWLNEGFASWMEYKAVDSMFPKWDMWTQFYTEDIDTAFSLDGLETSHPIEVPVINPDEIGEIFDAVSYSKGSCIIRMLEQYVGPDVFRNGLRNYLKKFSYGNATTEDLWTAVEEASEKPVRKMMNTWTKQTGYPVVSVAAKNNTNNTWTLTQERFLYTRKKEKTRWQIPLAVQQGASVHYHEMNTAKITHAVAGNATLNPSNVGFYRVRYEPAMLGEKIRTMSTMNILDKTAVQGNQYALARSGYSSVIAFLDILPQYREETDYTLWADVLANLSDLKFLFAHTPMRDGLDAFTRTLVASLVKKLGWDEKTGEEHTTILLRATALASAGLSGDQAVIAEAKKRFADHLKNKNLNPNLRSVVYALAARNGGQKEHDQLTQLYREATLQEEKIRLLGALTMFKQEELLKQTLTFTLSKEVRPQDTMIGMARVAGNSYGTALALEFFKKNWNEFEKRYGSGGHILGRLIKEVCSKFATPDKARDIQQFFKTHSVPSARRAIEQSLEAIRINHQFRETSKKDLEEWLKTTKLK